MSNNAGDSTGANNNTDTTISVEKVGVTVENIDGIVFATNNVIHIAAGYIEVPRRYQKRGYWVDIS